MKIGIFTAMEKEASAFLRGQKVSKMGAYAICQFSLGSHQAVLCCPPTVGEIAAASACQLLIDKFGVDVILNFGVVGALTKDASAHSAMYVGSVAHYDMDTSAMDNVPVGRYLCFDDVAVSTDEKLLSLAQSVRSLPVVRCASADKFVESAQSKQKLNVNFGADICDMESAGVLFTCKFNNVPCLLVKCVADSLFGGVNEYEQNASKATQSFFDFATKLAQTLN